MLFLQSISAAWIILSSEYLYTFYNNSVPRLSLTYEL